MNEKLSDFLLRRAQDSTNFRRGDMGALKFTCWSYGASPCFRVHVHRTIRVLNHKEIDTKHFASSIPSLKVYNLYVNMLHPVQCTCKQDGRYLVT